MDQLYLPGHEFDGPTQEVAGTARKFILQRAALARPKGARAVVKNIFFQLHFLSVGGSAHRF